MVQFEAIFTGIAIAQESRNVMSGEASLKTIKEAVFKTQDNDILSVIVDQWTAPDSMRLKPGDHYRISVIFETSSSRFMGVSTLSLRATAVNIVPLPF